jgi:mycothiol synthase
MGDLVRRPIAEDDCKAWASLLAAAVAVDDTGEHYDSDDLLEELADPTLDAARDTLGLWLDDAMIGYGVVRGAQEVVDGAYRVTFEGTVHPGHRRRGHGRSILDWSLGRAAEIHTDRHPEVPGLATTSSTSINAGEHAMLEPLGFERARWFFQMERPVTDPPQVRVPAGLRLVPFDPAYDEQTRLANNEAFADHWGTSPTTPQTWAHWAVGQRAFRPALSYLVLDDAASGAPADPVVGYLLSYEYESDTAATGVREAYVGSLGTRRAWRGRGVARALLSQAVTAFEAAGFDRTALNVDADNPSGALGLYTSLGFTEVRTSIRFARPI